MNPIITLLYRIYQFCILLPVTLISLAACGGLGTVMCRIDKRHADWWGTLVTRTLGKIIVRTSLLPVIVEGRENITKGQSYIFVANHQGAYDIFLICGYLGVEIRWMLKRSLEKIPFFGSCCRNAGYVFVDKGNAGTTRTIYRQAEEVLRGGASLMIFPEGARTYTGHMGRFKRSAFMLANEMQLPIVPLTVNGSFDVLPRMNDLHFINYHPLKLTIHKPIYPHSQSDQNVQDTMQESRTVIHAALTSKYQDK